MTDTKAQLPFEIFVIGDNQIRPSRIINLLETRGIPFQTVPPTFYSSSPNHFNQARSQILSKKLLSLSEMGCANSHLLCYKRLLDSDSEYALVLEDDAELINSDCHELVEIANMFINRNFLNTKSKSRLLLYYTESANLLENKVSKGEFLVVRGNPSHAMAYLLNRSAAKELLTANAYLDYVPDWPKGTSLEFYLTRRRLFNHGSKLGTVESLLERGRKQSKLNVRERNILNIRILLLVQYFANREFFSSFTDFVRILWWPLVEWQINRIHASSSETWGEGVKVKKSRHNNFNS